MYLGVLVLLLVWCCLFCWLVWWDLVWVVGVFGRFSSCRVLSVISWCSWKMFVVRLNFWFSVISNWLFVWMFCLLWMNWRFGDVLWWSCRVISSILVSNWRRFLVRVVSNGDWLRLNICCVWLVCVCLFCRMWVVLLNWCRVLMIFCVCRMILVFMLFVLSWWLVLRFCVCCWSWIVLGCLCNWWCCVSRLISCNCLCWFLRKVKVVLVMLFGVMVIVFGSCGGRRFCVIFVLILMLVRIFVCCWLVSNWCRCVWLLVWFWSKFSGWCWMVSRKFMSRCWSRFRMCWMVILM